jgi:hypothetical protein
MTRPKTPKATTKPLLSRTALAREKGVTSSAVRKACQPGGPLSPALVGDLVDASHPTVAAWLTETVRGPLGPGAPTKEEMLLLTKRKREAEATKLEIQNGVRLGELIDRELVKTHVIALIDAQNSALFRDAAQTITNNAMTMTRADEPAEEVLRMVRDTMSKHMTHARDTAVRVLKAK